MATSFFGPGSVGMPLYQAVQQHDRAKVQGQEGISATTAGDAMAPPGWEDSVKRMKRHKEISNPFALAWWMRRRGSNPAKHVEKADAAFDAAMDQAARLVKKYPLPKEYTAAARGEGWAINLLLDPNTPPLIVEAW